MSDWEVYQEPEVQIKKPSTDWEIDPSENFIKQEKEGLGEAALKAIPRIKEDIIRGGFNAISSIPFYFKSAQSEIPGAFNVLREHPKHALEQGIAGIAEAGKNIFNTPHDIINYLSSGRLNLIPEELNKIVQMGRMPEDTNQMINQTFGEPQYEGENLIRGTSRNALNLLGTAGLVKALNPLKLTNKGISKGVLQELDNQVSKHTKLYNGLWKDAQKKGINIVPYDQALIQKNLSNIKKYYSPKQYKSIDDFIKNPTLENAQRAQSDLGVLRRSIEENARTKPLLTEERKLLDSLENSERHIEGNMFKDAQGKINQKLADRYKKITNSYRENVVPYKYNSDIQAYKNKELTAKELVQRLNKGEFAAKKGGFFTHPRMSIRNALIPTGLTLGGLGGVKYLYDQLLGNPLVENKEK